MVAMGIYGHLYDAGGSGYLVIAGQQQEIKS
jgi:hypothetical protein